MSELRPTVKEYRDAWAQIDAHSGDIGVEDENNKPCDCRDCEAATRIVQRVQRRVRARRGVSTNTADEGSGAG